MARSLTARFAAGRGFAGTSVMRDDAGFTLVESLVSFAVFMILVGSATFWLVKTIQVTGTTRNRVAAANLAAQELEKIRGDRNSDQQLDTTSHVATLHGTNFTVTPSFYPTTDCATGSSRRVTVTVTWNGAVQPIRYASVLAC